MTETAHDLVIFTYINGWNEYRAHCSCGHVGRYRGTKLAAQGDHDAHADEARR